MRQLGQNELQKAPTMPTLKTVLAIVLASEITSPGEAFFDFIP
jgi:hypothetical protein